MPPRQPPPQGWQGPPQGPPQAWQPPPQPPPQAWQAPVPAKIGLGRSNVVLAIGMLAFFTVAVVICVRGALDAENTESSILVWFFAALFAGPLVMVVIGLPRMLAPRYVLVNPAGLGIQHGRRTVMVAWPDIAAYGIGYAIAEAERPKMPTSLDQAKEMVADRITAATMEALQISAKRQIALEIFPAAPHLVDRYPKLRPYWKPQPPPPPGMPPSALPPMRWRFGLPPVVSISEQIAGALYAWSPPRWTGWIGRPWQAGRGK